MTGDYKVIEEHFGIVQIVQESVKSAGSRGENVMGEFVVFLYNLVTYSEPL